ncbi:MAG: DNA mismatch repair protein MutS [Treponema sp.]|nr:DNA mismatch repair protein MutS [Treponema sp.]
MADETPLFLQYQRIKAEHQNEVLFFRVGDFYEMFNDDALEVSRLLNLTLTHRGENPMCGIPFHASKVYIARLLRLGKKIAIAEQVGEIAPHGGLTERKVVETITPGTATESEYLDGGRNNFLAALYANKRQVGFSYIDVTTGEFRATSFERSRMAEHLPNELGRCAPRELLLCESLKTDSVVQEALDAFPGLSVSAYADWSFNHEFSYKQLTAHFNTVNLRAFSLSDDAIEIVPAGFLLDYLRMTAGSDAPHVTSLDVYRDEQYVVIDDSSRRNLEITANLRDGTAQFTLLECVNYTRTAMGSRMLREWLLFPLMEQNAIMSRQDHVELFVQDRALHKKVREELNGILDIERLAGRIALDRAHAKDLQALRASLAQWLRVQEHLGSCNFATLNPDSALDIINLVEASILEDPATALTEGGIIKDGWSSELDHWRSIQTDFTKVLDSYLEEERERTGIANLRIRKSGNMGYFIEVTRGKVGMVPEHFIMRRSLVNADRYTTEKLQELEENLNESGTKILQLERDLFLEVRGRLKQYIPYLQQAAHEIAYADVTASFAEAAIEHRWVRPRFTDTRAFDIRGGRHPVVERHLPAGEFVPNDLSLCADGSGVSFALITGPNMAGKSTFLRQNALIALLAQTGSFVPCDSALLSLVDRIFCRVGASDNLARGESTFLVEMTETAHILRTATIRSLVIMDEVGRGTSTEDGLSIAWAVSEYLLSRIKCKTLFATHYHELTRLEHPALLALCMAVNENGSNIVFLRKVISGASANSYGIHVAQLAGLPQPVVDRARWILERVQEEAAIKPIVPLVSVEGDSGLDSSDNDALAAGALGEASPVGPDGFDGDDVPQPGDVSGGFGSQPERGDFALRGTGGAFTPVPQTTLHGSSAEKSRTGALFSDEELILDEILSVNVDTLTPLSALQLLDRWKKTLSGR